MSQGYQTRDAAIVDYQLWQATDGGRWLRGPRPEGLEPGSYFACVGAAQTFGCFTEQPWPSLLSQQLNLPVLNLGQAGAGPALFRTPALLQLLRGARFVVYQVMSGRSADCSLFQSGGQERLTLPDGRELGAGAAWAELLHADLRGITNPILRGLKNRWLAQFGRSHVRRLVAETQANWTAEFQRLIEEVNRPSALLWFSKRPPQYQPRYHSLAALFGEFPQLVDAAMVQKVMGRAQHYVECVTSRGSPQLLKTPVRPADAGTGEPRDLLWTHNSYYPSPEMHEDAAAALLATCQALAADSAP
jgi:hypothetical protein